ncbi:MAG: DNA-formamidopyrimidine glycosylase family protein [Propionicimonas sp.]|nr:DNA-formamidopyrimidine glycosylase family protein [Propionicimonas sp.]
MPEGDAVWRTARRLHEALAGRVLLAADLRWPNLSTARLAGVGVDEVVPRGKHLLARFDNGWTLHSHLRMDGSWVVEPTATPPRRVAPRRSGGRPESRGGGFVRAVLVGPEWTAIGVDLGMLDLVRTDREHTLVGHLGPDLLDPGFDAGLAVTNLAAAEGTVGAALLDQSNLAGIGTIWASETLFAERVPPWTPVRDVPSERLARIVERARMLLTGSIQHPVPTSTGVRQPGRTTYVHGRSGRPCRRCGATVRVASIGAATRERPMFYCPGCQGGLGPTDDGRPIGPLGALRR